MKLKRSLALLLTISMLLALAGCSGRSFYEALGDAVLGTGKKPGSGDTDIADREGYFPDEVWRADTSYADMAYEHYELDRFEACADVIYDFAENGGDPEEYEEADYALWDELYYVYTLYILASNRSYADAGNSALSQEAAYALETYYGAYDEFMLALKAMALSEHSGLMEDQYDKSFVEAVKYYESATEESDELTSRENALVSRYYAAVSAQRPDERELGEIFVELVNTRNAIARAAGYESYAAYAYDSIYIKDYTPEDAQAVWQGAREYIAPMAWRYAGSVSDRAALLEADRSFDCSPETVLETLGQGARRVSGEVYEAYEYLTERGLYDIEPSEKKAEVGFTTFLSFYNEPFIFNAPYGTFYDYLDMMHEFGHFVNYFYYPAGLVYSMPDNDLSELQSQGMTMVMTYFFDDLFGRERGDVMRDQALLELALSVIEGAMYDEFQQRVYAEADLTPERVNEIYAQVYTQYGYSPYDGYESEWMYVSHNFESPFYYISYAVSALGALEINELCRSDFETGIDKYLTVLAMDPEVWYYSEALKDAGLGDIFDPETYAAAARALEGALNA